MKNLFCNFGVSIPLGKKSVVLATLNSKMTLNLPKGLELRVQPALRDDLKCNYAPSTGNLTVAQGQTKALIVTIDEDFGEVKIVKLDQIGLMTALASIDPQELVGDLMGSTEKADSQAIKAKLVSLVDAEGSELKKLFDSITDEMETATLDVIKFWANLLMVLDWDKVSAEVAAVKAAMLPNLEITPAEDVSE